jgi:hypothetical protein
MNGFGRKDECFLLGSTAAANSASHSIRRTARGWSATVMSLLAGIVISVSVATPGHAITCTDRQQVCFRYCEKNYANVARCKATCGSLLNNCMSTGCWESKVTARQCGITKQ